MIKAKFGFLIKVAIFSTLLIFTIVGCSSSSDSKTKYESTASSSSTPSSSPNNSETTLSSAKSAGIYEDYSAAAITDAKSTDKIILFFHASWCPTCKEIERDIKANLGSIPKNVRILKVDFDSEKDLKNTYGVRQQYTMVQVDNTGKKLGLWSDSFSLDDILETAV